MWLTKKETAEKAESVKTGVVTTGGVCLGVVNDAGTLLPGEVRLFSAGGAEIVLKLDGTVVINGQVFEKKEE